MATPKKAPRGLDALLGKKTTPALATPDPLPGDTLASLPTDTLTPCPLQPRKNFPKEALDELAESIRAQGIIQPLIVRPTATAGRYEIIAGERRWRAAQIAGLAALPVIIRQAKDREVLELALIENLQRAGLNPIEEAEGYARLAKEFQLTQEQIAEQVGKSRAAVANALRLLELDPAVREHLAAERISTGHGKVILSLKDHSLQRRLADAIIRDHLSVRATEKLCARILGTADIGQNKKNSHKKSVTGKSASDSHAAHIGTAEAALRKRFGSKVTIHHKGTHGSIEIEYYSIDDLNRLLELWNVEM